MGLTREQRRDIIDFIEDIDVSSLEAGVFVFGDVKIRVNEPTFDGASASVTFKVIAGAEDARDVNRVLNRINDIVDGDLDPNVRFDDDSPSTPNTITDTFNLTFSPFSGVNLIDV